MTQLAAVLTAIEEAKHEGAAAMKSAIIERVREKAQMYLQTNVDSEQSKDEALVKHVALLVLATELEAVEITQEGSHEENRSG